jgi:hypothetical protein
MGRLVLLAVDWSCANLSSKIVRRSVVAQIGTVSCWITTADEAADEGMAAIVQAKPSAARNTAA